MTGGAERDPGHRRGRARDTGDLEVYRAYGHGRAGWRTPTWSCGLVENTSYQGDLALNPRVVITAESFDLAKPQFSHLHHAGKMK